MEKERPSAKRGHELRITDRERGSATGIEKVVSSGENTLNLITSVGTLTVTGEKLHIIRYDASLGTLEFDGTVNSVKYGGGKQSLIKRIFK